MASNINVESAFSGTTDYQSIGTLNGQGWNDAIPHSFTGTGIIHTQADAKLRAQASITILFCGAHVNVRFGLVGTPNELLTVAPSDTPITFNRRSLVGWGNETHAPSTYLEQLYKLDNYSKAQYFPRNRNKGFNINRRIKRA